MSDFVPAEELERRLAEMKANYDKQFEAIFGALGTLMSAPEDRERLVEADRVALEALE